MVGQWIDYDNFNLVELIDELKTRIKEPHRVDDILHGMIIAYNNYSDICIAIREYLENDDNVHKSHDDRMNELRNKSLLQTSDNKIPTSAPCSAYNENGYCMEFQKSCDGCYENSMKFLNEY